MPLDHTLLAARTLPPEIGTDLYSGAAGATQIGEVESGDGAL